ncbi:MAG: SEC-C metal-binding domain-containing protein [Gemmataceae bacterium]
MLDAVRQVYLDAEWHFRLYAGGAMDRIHSDAAVQVLTDLLEKEPDAELKDGLASGLAGQFSTEGNEAVYRYFQIDSDSYDAMSAFVVSCALTGQAFPELQAWTAEVKGLRKRPGGWKALIPTAGGNEEVEEDCRPAPALQPIVAGNRPGRNDPCPCGSGKKYKKCCLHKEELL